MAKTPVIDPETFAAVVAAIDAASRAGCPVIYDSSRVEETARLAVRRWRSSARRGIDQADQTARVRDLTRGFIEQLESDPKMVGPLVRDYEYLAGEVAKALMHR
jgi:hypothetical protein